MLPNGHVKSCSNCHFNPGGGGRRNPFGLAVEELVTPGGMQVFWGPALAALDSDGDGVSNGEELGDPEGQWVEGDPAPGDPARVTNPGDPDDLPEPAPAAQFRRGDFNSDGQVNISDPIGTLNFLFLGQGSSSCMKAVDVNGDGSVNISDATFSLNFLFAGGPTPPAPFPDCGPEPEDNITGLECEAETCV